MSAEIFKLLKLNPDEPATAREIAAVDRDQALILALVHARTAASVSEAQILERTGWAQADLDDFERTGADPHLSEIRAYALAVGVDVLHRVVSAVSASEGEAEDA